MQGGVYGRKLVVGAGPFTRSMGEPVGGIIGGCPGGSKEVRLALPVCGGVGVDSELVRCVGVGACAQSCRERRRI